MESRGMMKTRSGVVINDKIDKSIVVRIERTTKHAKYKRVVRRTSKLMAHDKDNQAKLGDKVRVKETRPMSGQKRWRLLEILK
ncbi:MAG: 30S ribosomal protein S17 [Candidatus Omnitrophica bacterium]|nr:30S ribosomal protein S17 [Candidatus Omnitrophota bacterium]MBU1932332.1 30S ribosomal protein S17 [Candidatus Omnitrophota bacterium]